MMKINTYIVNDGSQMNYAVAHPENYTDLISRLLSYRKQDFSHIPEPCEEMF